MKKLSFLLFLSLLCIACEGEEDKEPNCELVDCLSDTFFLDYQDVDGNPLIGAVFVQDSFKLSSPTRTIYLKVNASGFENILPINFNLIESGVDYELALSPTESDKFNFTFNTNTDPCCPFSSISDFQYNDTTLTGDATRTYLIVR